MNLTGTWKVKVTSGPVWFRAMNLIGDKKIIDKNSGYNVAAGIKWGKFQITQDGRQYILTYTEQPIVDRVKFVGGRLAGSFTLNDKYIGEFEMKEVKE